MPAITSRSSSPIHRTLPNLGLIKSPHTLSFRCKDSLLQHPPVISWNDLKRSENWSRCFLYTLVIGSTFSIALTEASIILLYLIGLGQLVWRRQLPDLRDGMLQVILAYMAIAVLASWLAGYGSDLLMALRTHWRLLLPFVLAGVLAEANEERIIQVFAVFLFIIAVYGIAQFFSGAELLRFGTENSVASYGMSQNYHAEGNFSHHLTFGGVLLPCFALFAALSLGREWSFGVRLLTAGLALLLLGALVVTLGRSTWLGTGAVLFVLGLWRLPKTTLLVGMLVAGLGAFLLTQTFSGTPIPSTDRATLEVSSSPAQGFWEEAVNLSEAAGVTLVERFESIFSLEKNRDRLFMWESGITAIQDHPWWGIGDDMDESVMPQYREPYEQTGHRFLNGPSAGVHNIYIQTWLNYGVFGFFAYLCLWAVFFKKTFRAIRRTRRYGYENAVLWGVLAGIVGLLVAGVFENNFRDGEVQTCLLMLMGLSLRQMHKAEKRIFRMN